MTSANCLGFETPPYMHLGQKSSTEFTQPPALLTPTVQISPKTQYLIHATSCTIPSLSMRTSFMDGLTPIMFRRLSRHEIEREKKWRSGWSWPFRPDEEIGGFHHYRARLKGGPQVAWMLQARPGRSGKQQQQQNSPNFWTAFFLAEPCTISRASRDWDG